MWFSSKRTKTTQPSSIDKANVVEQKGELYFDLFELTPEIRDIYEQGIKHNKLDTIKKLYKLLGSRSFLKPFYDEIITDKDSAKDTSIYIQNIRNIENYSDKIEGQIRRARSGHIDGHDSGQNIGLPFIILIKIIWLDFLQIIFQQKNSFTH